MTVDRPRRWLPPSLAVAALALVLALAGCSADEPDSAGDALGSDSTVRVDGSSGAGDTATTLAATTTMGLTTTTGATTTTTTTGSTTTTTTGSTTTTTEAPTGKVITRASFGAFVSPSGNIACVMSEELGASCWIAEKEWEAPEPVDCDLDHGNVIDLTADGVEWPCYGDVGWDPFADPLPYGDAMVVGPYRCDSARTGVTCRNGQGQSFTLARAAVTVERS